MKNFALFLRKMKSNRVFFASDGALAGSSGGAFGRPSGGASSGATLAVGFFFTRFARLTLVSKSAGFANRLTD